jgi:hypothetical protein
LGGRTIAAPRGPINARLCAPGSVD